MSCDPGFRIDLRAKDAQCLLLTSSDKEPVAGGVGSGVLVEQCCASD